MRFIPYTCILGLLTLVLLPMDAQGQISGDTIAYSIDFDDVVITAQYAPTHSKKAVHKVTTISKETIERRAAINLKQLVLQETSLRVKQDNILGTELSLQGLGGQGVKILVDGVPVIGRQDGYIDISQIRLDNVERIEIVEGPMGVMYGTDALGGVVNIITKKSQIQNLTGGFNAQYEDLGFRNLDGHIGYRPINNILFRAAGGTSNFLGVEKDSSRETLWNPKEQLFYNGLVRWNINEDHNISYTLSHFEEKVDQYGAIRRPQFKPYAFDDEFLTQRDGHAVSYNGKLKSNAYVQSTGGINFYKRRKGSFRTSIDDSETELVPGQQDTSAQRSYTWRTSFAKEYSSCGFLIGADLRYDEAESERIKDTSSIKDGAINVQDYAIFTSLRYSPITALTMEVGARFGHNSRFRTPITPSFNLRYQIIPQLELRSSYGRGFRSPDLKELFFNFIDINHNITGNPELKPEESNNFQLGMTYKREKGDRSFSLAVTGFYNQIQNRIELFEYYKINEEIIPAIDTITGDFTYFNQSIFKSLGVNSNLGIDFGNFSINGGLSITGFYNPASESFSEIKTFSPIYDASIELSYSLYKNWSVSLFARSFDKTIQYYPARDTEGNLYAAQREIEGYEVVDFIATKFLWNSRIQLSAGVKNLLDVQSVTVGQDISANHTNEAVQQPVLTGRNYFARLTFVWGN